MGALRGFVVSASALGLALAALSGAACSGDDNTGTGGASSSTSPSSSSGGGEEGAGGAGGEGGTSGVGGSGGSGGASAQAPYRAGPERLMAAEHDFGGFDERILRCPLGSLLTAIEIAHPDQASPPSAELLRLVCSTLNKQGALVQEVFIEGPFNYPAGWVFTRVSCPAGQVATRITGSYDEDDATPATFTSLGLGCHAPTAVADGAAGGASTPSEPASFGPEGPVSFDDGCPAGAGMAGIVVRYTASFGTPEAAGFSALRGLCRDVLHETVPGGGPWDLSKPFALGAVSDAAPISLTTFPLPNDNKKVTRDCPDGSVVTSVNGGKTAQPGPHSLSDIWLTCRALGSQAELGVPVGVGGMGFPPEAPCLDGAAVKGLRFTKAPAAGAGFPDTSADLGGDCVLPIDTPTVAEPSLPPWAPVIGSEDEMAWLMTSCPAGAVLTGVNLWGPFPEGDGALGGVGARCRMVTR